MSTAEPAPPRESHAPSGPAFWAGTAAGLGIVAFGLAGLLRHSDQTHPLNWLRFFLGGLIAHDALWAPLVGIASLALVRLVPRVVRPALQGTLLVSAAAVLVVIPAWTGRGRNPNNPSILPGHYGTDLLKVLAVVWLAGALVALRALTRRGRRRGGPGPSASGW